MEAVPRLHMLSFPNKSSPEGTSFAGLKKYIAEFYQENPDNYSKELYALETLRNQALNTPKDNCAILKRYFCQLESLLNRFPKLRDKKVIFQFTWKDLYNSKVQEYNDIGYEQAAVLYNVAAAHTQAGAAVNRTDIEGMKLACTHFQCAAWAFGEIRERYINMDEFGDCFTTELLVFMQQVSFAQAQECILEKSLIDNRKPNIVAKVTAQIVVYYGAALAALLTGGDDGPVAHVVDSAVYKQWKKYVRFKISYLSCILYLYQGQHAEEQRKMGERVTLYEAAWEKLEEARKESKGLPDIKEINESLIFTADVVEAKRKNAKNENEFIYHESVPELATISAVQGANLVNGIGFSATDPEIAGEDIFARLVPMKAHEASSMYSEEKAKLLRKYGNKIEEKDGELASFMSSLTLDNLNINEEKANKIPQGIVDRCAALNANKTAIPELVQSMSRLAEICGDVEANLKEISMILQQEEKEEKEFQQLTGVQRTPNAHITELTREFQKYSEAHNRAGESNDTLRKAMELHINNLKILAKPLQDIQQSVPKLSSELNTAEVFKDVKLIVNKVNEMKAQRSQFHADLRIAVNDDDITTKIIAHDSEEDLQALFDREMAKHERLTQLIDQNLLAQENILKALTESYAKAAPVLKTLADVKNKREGFFASLAASYDVYEDLLAKSAKGLEFYNKLSANVQKLLSRCKSARDVQSEERQQRLKSVTHKPYGSPVPPAPLSTDSYQLNNTTPLSNPSIAATTSTTPKLRDYLNAKKAAKEKNLNTMPPNANTAAYNATNPQQYIPPVRPNPLGSENPTQAVCSGGSSYYPPTSGTLPPTVGPNEPPPPYTQYYDTTGAGYTNPMFLQYQQNIAPPAYKPQASPNSQFTALNANMANLNLQQQPQQNTNNTTNPLTGVANTGNYPQMSYNSLSNNPQNPLVYQGNNQNYLTNQPTYPNNQQTYLNQASLNNNNTTSLPYSTNNPPTSNMTNNSLYAAQSTVSNTPQMYTPSPPVVTTAAATTYTPQPYFYGTNTPASNNLNPTYQQSSQQNSYQTPPTSVPTNQPLYVATNQTGLPSSTTLLQSTAQNMVPPTMQAPFVVNHLPNTQTAPATAGSTNLQQTPQIQNPLQVVGTNATMYPSAAVPAPVSSTSNALTSNVVTSTTTTTAPFGSLSSSHTTMHPGYSFNPQTGNFNYNSGYQQTNQLINSFMVNILQEAAAVNTQQSPIVSHTKPTPIATVKPDAKPSTIPADNMNYYNAPYGYQTNGNTPPIAPIQTGQLATGTPRPATPQQTTYQQPQTNIYIQSGTGTTANTQTTKSGNIYATSSQQSPMTKQEQQLETPAAKVPEVKSTAPAATTAPAPKPVINTKKSSNIDLLSDIDFSGVAAVPPPILPQPVLKPQVVSSPPTSQVAAPTTPKKNEEKEETQQKDEKTKQVEDYINSTVDNQLSPLTGCLPAAPLQQLTSPVDSPATRKASFDNLSNCSDISSLDNFDWDSVSMRSDKPSNNDQKHSGSTFQLKPLDPFNDDKTLKYFHKEVERFEKFIESLNVKMLNGHTPLSTKWKELQDLLGKEAPTRTTSIAKLFPEKNRSLDCLPYDHARVKLDKETDDYINAAFVKNLSTGCPNFIIAQTPQQNTINDFWSMIWSQKARTILSLHTPNEMLDPFWPQSVDKESNFDDFTVKCIKIIQLSHCIEYQLKLSMLGADAIIELSVLQIKTWTKSTPPLVVGIARNALQAHQQRCLDFNTPSSPLVLNCLTGSERSEIVAIGISAILATQNKRPVLINVIDVWLRICSQRQKALRDVETLEQSLQIVLNHAHDVLNKRGIMTSYQMKIAPQVTAQEKQATKDPLNELDALWKLK
ncbi:tyrosine-protein phosphatase non-receptor type 23-like [Lucilia sericata]|uniref:tyrosine-protein phosphatase non-receptor type 23-like n=1 Tax=Lucilia sericata TaxID=13632 RepID=UPI0018A82F8E|nr:tyrosine-protein phosphatase non-receptor type 23-like [Lucilia sericata]